MAFDGRFLTLGRGRTNRYSDPIGSAIHLYKTTDLLDEVTAANYFPPFFGSTEENVKINDTLIIYAGDGTKAHGIFTADPLVLTGSIFGGDTVTTNVSVGLSGPVTPVGYIIGINKTSKTLTLVLPAVSLTFTGVSVFVTTTPIDFACRPAADSQWPLIIQDTGPSAVGNIQVGANGLLTVAANPDISIPFSGPAGTVGWSRTAITYAVP